MTEPLQENVSETHPIRLSRYSSSFNVHRDIYLIFCNATYKGNWLFKKGFQHVYAIERQALGWMCLDPSRSDLISYILPAPYNAEVMKTYKAMNPDCTVVHLHVEPHDRAIYPRIGALSCVSTMQYLIGIYSPLVLTPYQLYNKLISKTYKHIKRVDYDRPKNGAP